MYEPPYIENARTMVPFRFIGESIGAEIGWDPELRKVTYTLGEQVVELIIDSNIAYVNGQQVHIDEDKRIVPVLKNARTMVPVRFVSEALGLTVEWDALTQTVTISYYS